MSWLRLDDGFAHHPKIVDLTDREFRVWTKTLLWCARYRTGGQITRGMFSDVGLTPPMLAKYLNSGLLDTTETGWAVHDFDEYNPRDTTAAERMRRYRDRNADRNDERNDDRNEPRNTPVTPAYPSRARAGARGPSPTPAPNQDLSSQEKSLSSKRGDQATTQDVSTATKRATHLIRNGGYQLTDYSLDDELTRLNVPDQDRPGLREMAHKLQAAATPDAPPTNAPEAQP